MQDEIYDRFAREDVTKTEPLLDFSPGEVATTVAEFLLSPSIPESERASFKKFAVMFSHIIALTNIDKWERVEWVCALRVITMLLEQGDYESAHALEAEYLMLAQLGRSIGGLNMLYGLHGITKSTVEYLEPPQPKKTPEVKRGLMSRIVGGLRGR